jgi:hypothetical protein
MSRSPEYYAHINSPAWRKTSKRVRWLTLNRCCLFPWLRAKKAHHLGYRPCFFLGFQIAGFGAEIPGLDAVGVSGFAHWLIHDCPLVNLLLWKCKSTRFVFNLYLRVIFFAFVGLHIVLLPIELLLFLGKRR